jgi:hypothetical protein
VSVEEDGLQQIDWKNPHRGVDVQEGDIIRVVTPAYTVDNIQIQGVISAETKTPCG